MLITSVYIEKYWIKILYFFSFMLVENKNVHIFAPRYKNGPFVQRLGRQVFILETGVRFPYGLQKLTF
jgi:hypothetical protein